jgi:hypothetical protein
MPTQSTDLFLLEDLKDVGRTSELAESDLDALAANPRMASLRKTSPASLVWAGETCPREAPDAYADAKVGGRET